MITYQTRQNPTTCSLCSETIPAGAPFQYDHFMDDEDGTFCLPCVQEYEDQCAQAMAQEADWFEDGDASRKFALENRD